MITENSDQFVNDYIEAWSTTNATHRKQLINNIYSEEVDFYADEPGDEAVHHHGWENIYNNISQVNKRLVQDGGLTTESTGYAVNHDAVKVTWQMKTPDGNIAVKGINILLLDVSGKIIMDYIFIG